MVEQRERTVPGTGEDAEARTLSGEPLKPLYTAEDLEGFDPETRLGRPGEYPFTRGVYPTMYRGRLWTMRQFAGSARPPRRTRATASCSTAARAGSPSRSTCRR